VISGIAMASGPTLGGLLAAWFGWRWIFCANIPFCLALALAVPRFVAETNDPNGRPLDPIGIVLLTISLGLAVDALLRREASLAMRVAGLAAGATAMLLFILQQRLSSRQVFDASVFATPAMTGVGALLTAIQFGYWAVLVYLPLFLRARLQVSIEVAGVALLAATLPMLVVPLLGGRFVTRWGWRHFFMVAFGVLAAGDLLLLVAALSISPAMRLAATIAGMLTIGVGAALANPQMSSVALALAPPSQAGMTSAATIIVRQAGFALSIAALGAMLATTEIAAAFAAPFTLAAFVALAGMIAALVLLPAKPSQNVASGSDSGPGGSLTAWCFPSWPRNRRG